MGVDVLDQWISLPELSHRLGIPEARLVRLDIPHVKIGANDPTRLYRAEVVNQWLLNEEMYQEFARDQES